MSTTAETIVEQDPREKPGGGRLNPVPHVVRIVVVPNMVVSSSRKSHGPGHSHGLTDEELKLGEEVLKGMDAEKPTNRTSEPSKSMFEVLKPTDIVVVGPEPASVRVVDKDGNPLPLDENGQPVPRDASGQRAAGSTTAAPEPPKRRLFGHDDRHMDTVLRVWTESDTVEYQCDVPFEITDGGASRLENLRGPPTTRSKQGADQRLTERPTRRSTRLDS